MKKILIIFLIIFSHYQLLANDSQNSKVTNTIDDQLKTLQDLYISGALSGYEYEKEKKKILKK